MSRWSRKLVCALAVGGLDPGGGAGILADLRALAAAGAFGCAATSLLTVQSTSGLRSMAPVRTSEVVAQAEEVVRTQRVRAIKLGALGTAATVRAMAIWLKKRPEIPVVVDTVMLPTRGSARLLAESALAPLRRELLPLATLVTANVREAEVLTGSRVRTLDEARRAATELRAMGARAVLVKGGHLSGPRAVDVLAVGTKLVELGLPRHDLPHVHGAGCTLASLIAGRLAVGDELIPSVRWSKRIHHRALGRASDIGGELAVLVP